MRTWILTDHICRKCSGRILKCVTGNGVTPGGNPIYQCSDCGTAMASMGTQNLCWCGFTLKGQKLSAYICVSFEILSQYPDKRQELLNAFRACGCDEGKQSVGIMLRKDFNSIFK